MKTFADHPKAHLWSDRNELKPHQVSYGSAQKFWFDCDTCGHQYLTSCYNVTNARFNAGCPYCSTSHPKFCNNDECNWCFKRSFASHPKSKCWSKKNTIDARHVSRRSSRKRWFDCDKCDHDFQKAPSIITREKLSWCVYCAGQKLCEREDCHDCFKRSFASHPKSKNWSKRNKLKPRQVALRGAQKFWFDCNKCGHDYNMTTGHIYEGNGCPYCQIYAHKLCKKETCQHCFKRSFASHPKAKYWSKKNKLKPHQVALHSGKKFWFDCDKCEHQFQKLPIQISSRDSWCPYCAGRKRCEDEDCNHCFKRSFASHPKAKCWSQKNKLKPRQVALNSNKKFLFDCDKCPHEFNTTLCHISQGGWCPFCCIPTLTLCGDAQCQHCFKRSFASHEKARYWSKKNKKKSHEVCKHSSKKYLFECNECNNTILKNCNSVVRGEFCPHCVNKTETKLLEWLQKQPIIKKVKHQYKPKWCSTEYRCIIKKKHKTRRYQYKYDFLVTLQNGKQIIIELDGPQHSVQVSNWETPFHNQIRDAYKERKARQHKLKVIRILQEDVWSDRGDWESELTTKLN